MAYTSNESRQNISGPVPHCVPVVVLIFGLALRTVEARPSQDLAGVQVSARYAV